MSTISFGFQITVTDGPELAAATMTKPSTAKSFTKALENLEQLIKARAMLNACDWKTLDRSINREIQTMQTALPSIFWKATDRLLEHRNRLLLVKTRLNERHTNWDKVGLDLLVKEFQAFDVRQHRKGGPARYCPAKLRIRLERLSSLA